MPRKETIYLRGELITGRFGDPVPETDQPAWREVPGAVVVPRSSGDFEQRGSIIIKGFMVKLPSSVQVEDTDTVKIRGDEYEIDGAVGDYGKAKIFYTIGVNV
jgi:hypothetical protein